MARSDLLALIALTLASCAPVPPTTAPPSLAPAPQAYSCAFTRRLKVEYDALPPTAALRIFVDDSIRLRDQNRAVRREPDPAPCPAAGERSAQGERR